MQAQPRLRLFFCSNFKFLAQQKFRGTPDLREVDESFLLDQAVFVHIP